MILLLLCIAVPLVVADAVYYYVGFFNGRWT